MALDGTDPDELRGTDPADVVRARTDRAVQACRHSLRTRLGRLVLVPVVGLALYGQVSNHLLVLWLIIVALDSLRAQLSIHRLLRGLARHGADPRWARRAAKGWFVAGSAFASVALVARTAHTTEALFVSTTVVMGALALAVVVAQGFTELLVAFASPVALVTTFVLFTGPASHRLIGLVGLVYFGTLAQIHREFGGAVRGWALLKARNERLNDDLLHEREVLRESQADLESVNDRLAHEATHDPLTGLANRTLLITRMHAALRDRKPGRTVGVLFVDLDRFKLVNDTLGHAIGDGVLCEAARRMRALLRETDTVARVGGDEFVVVLPQLTSPDVARSLAERLRSELARAYDGDDGIAELGATVGVATSDGSVGVEDLLALADATMYRGKQAGRGTVVVAGVD